MTPDGPVEDRASGCWIGRPKQNRANNVINSDGGRLTAPHFEVERTVMKRSRVALLIVLALTPAVALCETAGFKSFNRFPGLVPGVDFFARSKAAAAPFTQPVANTHQRLETLFGSNLPKGAIFVCSSQKEKDSVWEPRALKLGYGWVLTVLTPEAQMDDFLSRMKQMGVEISPERLERMRSRMAQGGGGPGGGPAAATSRQMVQAVLQVMLAPEKQYRSSRLDDVGRTPLPDWLDMGIAGYAAGGPTGVGYLQQHLEESFTIDDLLTMSRPFVAPVTGQSSSGGGPFVRSAGGGSRASNGGGENQVMAPPQGMPASGPAPGADSPAGGGSRRTAAGFPGLSKDQQDRMLFDNQASAFFGYVLEKVGLERTKELISWAREGKEPRDFLGRPDVLGSDFDKMEEEWVNWVKTQKPDPSEMRMDRGPRPPQQ